MTLQECKDQVANKRGYKSFQEMERNGFGIGTGELLSYMDQAAELYASQFKGGVGQKEAFTLEDMERVKDWARCGIYHNHGYHEDKVKEYLAILDKVIPNA